jgi:predicted nucleic acid-binding protein
MYLIDTNAWLEILLKQERAAESRGIPDESWR